MLPRLRMILVFSVLCRWSPLLAEDEKKPVPESTTPATEARDDKLLSSHDQARNDADQAYRKGEYQKAIDSAGKIISENPLDHVAFYLRASSRIELGINKGDAATVRAGISDAREAIRIKPLNNANYFLPYLYGMANLAGLENKKQHAEVASKIADTVLAQPSLKNEDRSNILYQKALANVALEDLKTAIASYKQAVELTPNHMGARVGLADTLAASGQNDAALAAYSAAVDTFPTMPLVFNNRGMFYQHANRLDDALVDFTQALSLDPKYVTAYTNRGFVLMLQGRFEEAENDFTESLKLDAAQPPVLSLRAGSQLSRGEVNGAIKDYTDVLKWNSKNAVGHAELGFALMFAAKPKEALAEFDEANQLNPQLRFLLPWRYLAMMQLGQKGQADVKMSEAIARDPKTREWPDQLLVFLADKQSEADLRKTINRQVPAAADAQTCEAEFFVGHRKLLAGQKEIARLHFAQAVKTKATQLSAYRGANIALKTK